MPSGDRVAAILLLAFGVFVSVQSRELAYWTGSAPGPGFLPFWLGVLLAVSSAAIATRRAARRTSSGSAVAIDARSGSAAADGWRRVAALLALTTAAAVLGLVIGLVAASGIFIGLVLIYLRPGKARANWTIAAVAACVVWLVFVRWLAVPLPAGPFGF